jgi:hypothetical protein
MTAAVGICQQSIESNSKLFRTILFLDAAASYNGKGVYANTCLQPLEFANKV